MLKLPGIPTDIDTRMILAQYWTRVSFMEHAAIGAFARLTLELLSLGATPDLLRKATSSTEEEIYHAEISFSLASHYSVESIGPGEYPGVVSSGIRKVTKLDLVKEGFIDGFIGEGIAANMALWQSENTKDHALKDIFYIIYEDELKHALLGWEIVKWSFESANSAEQKRLKKTFLKIYSEFDMKYQNNEKADLSNNELVIENLSDFGMINTENYLKIQKDIYSQSLVKLEELFKKYSF